MIKESITKLILVTLIILGTNNLKAQNDDSIIPTSFVNIEIDDNKLVELLKASLKSDSTNLRHIIMLGSIWENHLQYDSAAIAYSKAISVDSTCIKCYQKLAGVMAGRGMIKKSIELYNKTLSLDTTNTTARTQLARLLKRESRFKEAYKQFNLLLDSDSTNFFLWEQIGDCAMRIDSIGIGLSAYNKSFDLNPANMPLAVKLINSFIQSSIPPFIILPYAERALQNDSTYIPIIRAKGYLLYLSQDYVNAESWLNKAYNLGDSTRFTLKFIGISKYHTNQYLSSATYLEKAYAIDTTDKALNFVLAKSLIEIGDRQKAIDILDLTERLITPLPLEMAMLYSSRGNALSRSQKYAEAIEQFNIALQYNPEQLEYLYEIGMCYFYAKDLINAKKTLTKFLELAEIENPKKGSTMRYISTAKHFITRIEKDLFFK
jgi:tetratricopeptide (TPR) repeat protein